MFPSQSVNATHLIDNLETQTPGTRLSGVKGASQIPDGGHNLVQPTWDNIAVPNHQIATHPAQFSYAMPGAYQHPGHYSPVPLWTHSDATGMPSWANRTSIDGPSHELQISDEEFAVMAAEMVEFWVAQRGKWQMMSSHVSRKQQDQPEPNSGAVPSEPGAKCEELASAGQRDSRLTKRRRTMKGDEAGDRRGAQKGDTEELPVQRSPVLVERKSKLGHHSLGMETLVVPPQGVSPPLRLGLTITDATLGSHQDAGQGWTEGRMSRSDFPEAVGIEDAHDENETDKQRWARLMLKENGEWKCTGCKGRVFSDRCTLQRHCRTAIHGKQRDWRKCPLCPNKYQRQSGVTRHMKLKHLGEGGKEGGI